jgi:hypothetical protein
MEDKCTPSWKEVGTGRVGNEPPPPNSAQGHAGTCICQTGLTTGFTSKSNATS